MVYNLVWSTISHLMITGIALIVFLSSEQKGTAFSLMVLVILSAAYLFSGKFTRMKGLPNKFRLLLSVSAPSLIALLLLLIITLAPGPMGFNYFYYIFYNPFTWLVSLILNIDPGYKVFIWTWPIPTLFIWLGLFMQKERRAS